MKNSELGISTFSFSGPDKCSGLEIVKYNEEKMLKVFGKEFKLMEEVEEMHITPKLRKQSFSYFVLKRKDLQ